MKVFLQTMNIIFFIIIFPIVIIDGIGPQCVMKKARSDSAKSEPEEDIYKHKSLLNNVRMEITEVAAKIFSKRVNLKLTERVLANQNLPVWILNDIINEKNLEDENTNDLIQNYQVMKEVGEFSTYQESKTSSSLVYFHKRQEFDGIIDIRICIRGLPIKYIDPSDYARLSIGEHGIYRNPGLIKHKKAEVNKQYPGFSIYANNEYFMRTHQDHVYDGYPEILVIVAWDAVRDWTIGMTLNEMDLYTTIVSYVITLFNGVDMLYSKLEDTKIQINIAGIIIGTKKESFLFLDKCYQQVRDSAGIIAEKMDTLCTMEKLKLYLNARKKIIQPDSYDLVVFLTSHKLFRLVSGDENDPERKYKFVEGTAGTFPNIYEMRVKNVESTLVAVIHENGDFGKYANVAHEVGHLMTVFHDTPPYFTDMGKCCGNIMKHTNSRCANCLSWSETSERTFRHFFSSPHCCTFINKPQSLFPPRRYILLSSLKQCQCFGHKSAKRFTEAPDDFCNSGLMCKTERFKFVQTVIPLHGTPCAINKVCYERKCVDIEVSPGLN